MGGCIILKEILFVLKNEEYQYKMIVMTYDDENLLKDSI